VGLKYGIITRDMAIICPVDASGKFMSEVTDFKGLHVKVSINTELHYRAKSM
jgi:isoleucyl-tRNA synthetase